MEEDNAQVSTEGKKEVKTYDISIPPEAEKETDAESVQPYVEQIRRLQADFENWRRRVDQEKTFIVDNASSALVEKLLPVIDSFERALQTPANRESDTAFKEGMTLIYRQLCSLLEEEGLTPIQSVGLAFDPKLHEAYAYEERETGEDHVVLEEARKGYQFKGSVLRPALVKVLKIISKQEDE